MFLLVVPLFMMVSLAGATAQGIVHIPTAIYDQALSQDSRRLVEALRNSQRFDPDYNVSRPEELENLLAQGKARVVVNIPRDFQSRTGEPQETPVQVLLDGTETNTALVASTYLDGLVQYYLCQKLPCEQSGVQMRARVWFNEELRSENFYIPAELGAIVAFLAVILTAVSITRERELGTLEQLYITPLSSMEIIVGKAIPALAITFVDFIAMLGLALFWFELPLKGSWGLLLALTLYYAFVEMGWGLLISVIAHTQGQALMAAFFFNCLEDILSGYIYPVEHMPRLAQLVSNLMPLKHYTVIIRGITLKSSTLFDLLPQVGALGLLGVGLFTVAALLLRRGLE